MTNESLSCPTTRAIFRRAVMAACTAIAVAGIAWPLAASATEAEIEEGHDFVSANCARCHAIGKTGESPLEEAPAFRDLHHHYPVENLAEALAEGIVTGHRDMPEFELTPEEITSVIAYLKTLEE